MKENRISRGSFGKRIWDVIGEYKVSEKVVL